MSPQFCWKYMKSCGQPALSKAFPEMNPSALCEVFLDRSMHFGSDRVGLMEKWEIPPTPSLSSPTPCRVAAMTDVIISHWNLNQTINIRQLSCSKKQSCLHNSACQNMQGVHRVWWYWLFVSSDTRLKMQTCMELFSLAKMQNLAVSVAVKHIKCLRYKSAFTLCWSTCHPVKAEFTACQWTSHIVLINDWHTQRKYQLIAVTFQLTYKLRRPKAFLPREAIGNPFEM